MVADADLATIAAFYRSATGCPLLTMQAEIEAINAAWNERRDPATDVRIQMAIDRVMKRIWHGKSARLGQVEYRAVRHPRKRGAALRCHSELRPRSA